MASILWLADGNSDSVYERYTSPKQTSLIIGTSKSAQGLQPKEFNRILGLYDVYNYSFNLGQSPYGPAYFKSIRRKLDTSSKKGVFILTVDPYSVSSLNSDQSNGFKEDNSSVGQIKNVNSFLNFDYLINHYNYKFIYLITKKISYVNDDFIHKDGWFEVNINMSPNAVEKRTKKKIKEYNKNSSNYVFSNKRYEFFEKTIEYLNRYGEVYLVRLPVSTPFLKMENSVFSGFENKIKNTSEKYNVPYLNMTDMDVDSFQYTDGNHLYKGSGRHVSQIIAHWIKSYE